MPALTFNVSKGRVREWYERVNANDPANSALIVMVLAQAGLVDDDVMRDYETFDAILAGASSEVTNTGYSRKVLTDADLGVLTVDHVNDRTPILFPTQSFGSPNVAAGDTWAKVVIGYDADTTSGGDTNITPITAHDALLNGVYVVPSGAPIIVSGTSGFAIAR